MPSLKIKKQRRINKKLLTLVGLFCLVLDSFLLSLIIIPSHSKKKEIIKEEIIKKATIIVDLKEDLSIPFYEDVKVSDFITNINGTIKNDYEIDTTKLGTKTIYFEYINEDNLTIPYSYNINIIDNEPPEIWLNNTKTITTNYSGDLLNDIVCIDNLDDDPICKIEGNYNTKKVGKYNLTFTAQDKYGNKTSKKFTLNVLLPSTSSNNSSGNSTPPKKTKLEDIIKEHKTDKTKIGIDVSGWQGDIDFQKVKEAGVEFVFIRVGTTKGTGGEYFLDKKFKRNIEGFTKVGIPVGIYFFSYASTKEQAISDATWVIKQIKDYKIDLPVVYDFEDWNNLNYYNNSKYTLTKNAEIFLSTLENAGYKGMLYSSANYLNKVWYKTKYDTWLAYYTTNNNYKGDYTYWQLCSNGKVPGIQGNVDLNIYYDRS